jgi:hypothetical protein
MKPVKELKRMFQYEPFDHKTVAAMERWLNAIYPEAKWTVTDNHDTVGGINVNCDFANEVERTFYTLKWL